MTKKKSNYIQPKSDALFKSAMETDVAAFEFLNKYLPSNLKDKLDISNTKVEKESYIEEDLKRRLSDVVYSIPYKNRNSKKGENVFIYSLIEHQSTPDKWIAFRLWKYTMLLCERHKKENGKLPIVIPFVLYNGKKKYNVPKNLWDLFDDPDMAKDIMLSDYHLIDLQAMNDDEIKQNQHLGMLQYMMKYIHENDMIAVWEKFFEHFKDLIFYDKEKGYIYIKKFIWYTDAKLGEENQEDLRKVILNNLPQEEGDNIMTTIAEKYIREGEAKGEARGKAEGIIAGEKAKATEIAQMMLKNGISIEEIQKYTSLSASEIKTLATPRKK